MCRESAAGVCCSITPAQVSSFKTFLIGNKSPIFVHVKTKMLSIGLLCLLQLHSIVQIYQSKYLYSIHPSVHPFTTFSFTQGCGPKTVIVQCKYVLNSRAAGAAVHYFKALSLSLHDICDSIINQWSLHCNLRNVKN